MNISNLIFSLSLSLFDSYKIRTAYTFNIFSYFVVVTIFHISYNVFTIRTYTPLFIRNASSCNVQTNYNNGDDTIVFKDAWLHCHWLKYCSRFWTEKKKRENSKRVWIILTNFVVLQTIARSYMNTKSLCE